MVEPHNYLSYKLLQTNTDEKYFIDIFFITLNTNINT